MLSYRNQQNEKETLGLVEVRSDSFSWPYPRGDILKAVVTIGDFTCSQQVARWYKVWCCANKVKSESSPTKFHNVTYPFTNG